MDYAVIWGVVGCVFGAAIGLFAGLIYEQNEPEHVRRFVDPMLTFAFIGALIGGMIGFVGGLHYNPAADVERFVEQHKEKERSNILK